MKFCKHLFIAFCVFITVPSVLFAQARFERIQNSESNLRFYMANDGTVFNAGVNGISEGLFWPRATQNSYVFGGGLWFAAEKRVGSTIKKLCEVGYDANSGASWYWPGEINMPNDGADLAKKYLLYDGTSFDNKTGMPTVQDTNTPPYRWPIWHDASTTHPLLPCENFNFGKLVSSTTGRDQLASNSGTPVIASDEDIYCQYSDADTTHNPEYKVGSGFPFGLNFQQMIYSWKSGPYRDVVYLRYQVSNTTSDTLFNCYLAPAFDPDVSTNGMDAVSAITSADSLGVRAALAGNPDYETYATDPKKLQMGYQYGKPTNGTQKGIVGIEFVETPIVANGILIDNNDSVSLGGYGNGSLYATNQLGLSSFRRWTIANDPANDSARYNFTSTGLLDHDTTKAGDMRALLSTGPFTFPPGRTVTATVALGIALASSTNKQQNLDSLVRLMANAHRFFADTTGSFAETGNRFAVILHHFANPQPLAVSNAPLSSQSSFSIYPNPANEKLTAAFSLQSPSEVSIGMYDILGREVLPQAQLKNVSAGEHTLQFDVASLRIGTYFLRLQTNGIVSERAVQVLK